MMGVVVVPSISSMLFGVPLVTVLLLLLASILEALVVVPITTVEAALSQLLL